MAKQETAEEQYRREYNQFKVTRSQESQDLRAEVIAKYKADNQPKPNERVYPETPKTVEVSATETAMLFLGAIGGLLVLGAVAVNVIETATPSGLIVTAIAVIGLIYAFSVAGEKR